VASGRSGEFDIGEVLISSENDRFILHESREFEAGEDSNYNVVKTFIESRKRQPRIEDQLHAVWLCFQVPLPGHSERLIERSAEQFLREKSEILGNIPTIVVFTKYDRLVNTMKLWNHDHPEVEAVRHLRTACIQPLQTLSGDVNISHVAVSSNKRYEQGQKDLIQLTFDKVSEHFVPQLHTPSPVPVVASMAQRVSPKPKIDGSILLVLSEYWRALAASPNFRDYTIQDCLRVVHIDIISVWNFHDPSNVRTGACFHRGSARSYHPFKYLVSEKFLECMLKMITDINPPETYPKPDNDFTPEFVIFLPFVD
ncbi:hypothetical protein ID866_8156, partial [Astraeus odoratus]